VRLGPVAVERRALPSKLTLAVVRVLAIVLALGLGAVILVAGGYSPKDSYRTMWDAAFASRDAIAETLVAATPLILTGLAVAVAARMLLWNIGAEGQLFFGAVFASYLAFHFADWPRPLLLAAMVVAGAVGGAVWAAVPGLLRALLNVNEIITTLMLNFVAILFVDYLVHGPWRDPESSGFPLSKPFTESAILPHFGTTRLHAGFLVALGAAVLVAVLLRGTRWGYEVRVIGESPHAARYAGIPLRRNIVLVLLLSGALAGIAGMGEVSGIVHRIQPDISPGYGYTGIIVATLAQFTAVGVVVAAILFGALQVGSFALQTTEVPPSIVQILQGSILFIAIGAEMLARFRISLWRRPEELAGAERQAVAEEVAP
jgi:simple sugar transport system permease protein